MTLMKFRDKVCELPDGGKAVLRLQPDNTWTLFHLDDQTRSLGKPVWEGKSDGHAIAALGSCIATREPFYT